MIKATCIQKFKKNNKIYGYRLQDSQGNTKDVYADQLKQAIRNQQITVINLTLTSDNRLIDTTLTQAPQTQAPQISEEEQKFKNLILKAKTLGFRVKEIPTYCGHHCILISKSETQHTIYIPDDVTHLNKDFYTRTFTNNIKELQGTLKVIGGHNLQDANGMFCRCQAQFLDLSSFNTSNVTDMYRMFYDCKAQSIDLSSFNTINVTDMNEMFGGCEAKSLDLLSFNTSNVTDIKYMFYGCQAQYIDISSFDTSNVKWMDNMFAGCTAKIKATDPKILERI